MVRVGCLKWRSAAKRDPAVGNGSRNVLFYKKEPKNFYPLARCPIVALDPKRMKVFLLLFLQKKKILLLRPSSGEPCRGKKA